MLLNVLSCRQDKRMDELNLFIEHYSKYIVWIIWARCILSHHLPHTNWLRSAMLLYWQLQVHSCMLCNLNQIESYQTSSRCNPLSMQVVGTLILLYYWWITNRPCMVSFTIIEFHSEMFNVHFIYKCVWYCNLFLTYKACFTMLYSSKAVKYLISTQKCHKVLKFWRKHTEGYQALSEK